MNGENITLCENASATGDAIKWRGGNATFMAEATWGGGSAKLQIQSKNGTWIDVASLTANGVAQAYVPPGQIRVAIATATAVYAYLVRNS